MSNLSLRLPDSLHETAKKLAKHDRISVNQFVTVAVAEKIAALMTEDYLEQRAQGGSREKFNEILSRVPDIDLEEYDRF